MPEVYENQNWVVNAVESEDVYRQMQAAGQVNSNELYLVQGDDTDKYDAVVQVVFNTETQKNEYTLLRGSYYDLMSKIQDGKNPKVLTYSVNWYVDIEMRTTSESIASLYTFGGSSVIKIYGNLYMASDESFGNDYVRYLKYGYW